MRISDWSSDVCSAVLVLVANDGIVKAGDFLEFSEADFDAVRRVNLKGVFRCGQAAARQMVKQGARADGMAGAIVNMSSVNAVLAIPSITPYRSEEHTSELQSLMRISYAVFCLKKKNKRL